MTEQEINDKIVEVLVDKLSPEDAKMQPETRLVEDLGADSLDEVEICMEIEDIFDIEVADDEWVPCRTVESITKLVLGKV